MPSEEGEWVALSVRLEIKPPTALHTLPLPVVAVAMAVAALLSGAEGEDRGWFANDDIDVAPPFRPPPPPLPYPSVLSSERAAVAALLAETPDSGGAQAGGVSPPFTVCAHSWFEVGGGRVAAAVLFAV